MSFSPERQAFLADTKRLTTFLASDHLRIDRQTAEVLRKPYRLHAFSCLKLSLMVIDGTVLGSDISRIASLLDDAFGARQLGYLVSGTEVIETTKGSDPLWPLEKLGIAALEKKYPIRRRTASVGVVDTAVTDMHVALKDAVSLPRTVHFAERGGDVISVVPERLRDRNGHGTAVCGIIGGRSVNGHRGVAPDSLITFAALAGSAPHDVQLVAALDWLCSQRISIVNVSFGFGGTRPAHELILSKVRERAVPICAVGNLALTSPGSTNEALSIGAQYESGEPWEGSATNVSRSGIVTPDLLAPGAQVSVPDASTRDSYRVASATSYAAPHIAGLFAALYERCRCEPSIAAMEQAVINSCGPRPSAASPLGRPDAVEAMERLDELCKAS